MKRGRKSKLQFGSGRDHMEIVATKANNMGIYTVESLLDGIYYFSEGDDFVVASSNGHVKMTLETAEKMSEEINGIINDIRSYKREGRKVMDSRSIGKMLERDFG